MEIFSMFRHRGLLLIYYRQKNIFDLALIPEEMENQLAARRTEIFDTLAARSICKALDFAFPTLEAESMIQFKITGTASANDAGSTMRNALCTKELEFLGQQEKNGTVTTSFAYRKNLFFDHRVKWLRRGVEISVAVRNETGKKVRFDYLSSFSLGMLSPFQKEDGAGNYVIHRVQSNWAAEGRHEAVEAEKLGLEMSWQAAGPRSLRFGQTSTKPVRKYFPFVGFEDRKAGVLWGAEVEALGAWELEVARFCDACNLSGGQPCRESCGWHMDLDDGARFETMPATVACVRGDILDLFNALLDCRTQKPRCRAEADLPPLFNEFCTTWGDPRTAKLLPVIDKVKPLGLRYFVLDDGWFRRDDAARQGDWLIDETKYDGSFDAFLDTIRAAGMIPGVWFEMETVFADSAVAKEHPEYLLTLDGAPIRNGDRLFLDLRREEARDFLRRRVIGFLRDHKIGYVKIDYNSSISCGCDGPDAPQENQRNYTRAVRSFYDEIRAALPELVIEICASGGHRLSPGWIDFSDMESFSDAHECPQLPMIALDVQMLSPMNKNQIWAVLREDDDSRRLHYSLAAAMLGRMCLSGEPDKLPDEKFAIVRAGVDFYRAIAPLLDRGSFRLGHVIGDYRSKPSGWQTLVRGDEKNRFVVVHTFENAPGKIEIEVPETMEIDRVFAEASLKWTLSRGVLVIENPGDFAGAAFLLRHI
ncbi:MAG: alpha-galactosidase [Victivallaceae bacterium]|nr:alpha-galactosidase [Victivallaceae bacterium]